MYLKSNSRTTVWWFQIGFSCIFGIMITIDYVFIPTWDCSQWTISVGWIETTDKLYTYMHASIHTYRNTTIHPSIHTYVRSKSTTVLQYIDIHIQWLAVKTGYRCSERAAAETGVWKWWTPFHPLVAHHFPIYFWWFGTWILFFHILGMSSSQPVIKHYQPWLTTINHYFRGIGQPPTRFPYSN